MSLLNFNVAMFYIAHKTLVLLKNHLNYLEDNILECLFKKYNRLLSFKNLSFFLIHNEEKSKA